MKRQLVKHGQSTLMISLPKKWLDKKDLEKGDSLEVIELTDKIIISRGEKQKKEKKISIYFPETNSDYIRFILSMLYRKGYEKIFVKFDDPKCIYDLLAIIRNINGFQIFEQKENSCIIKNIIKEIHIEVKDVLNKIINIIKTEFIIVREFLEKGIKNKESDIRLLREECWKNRNLIYLYLKENLLSFSFGEYFMIHIFEHNATFLYWLYRSFNKNSIKTVSKEFLHLYDQISEYFNKSILKTKEKKNFNYIMSTRNKLLSECEKYCTEKHKDNFLIVYLSMLVQNIHHPRV